MRILPNLNLVRKYFHSNDYAPIPVSLNSPTAFPQKRGYSRRHVLLFLALLVSIFINFWLIFHPPKYFPKAAVDNYQAL